MDKIFDPEYKTIKEIFEGSFYYQIPPYQRRYSWEDEHVEKLWDDVYTAFENQDEEYFLGSIILTINKEQEYFNVVDCQQRLTTLTILFCCLRDLYYKNHKDLTKRNPGMNNTSGIKRMNLISCKRMSGNCCSLGLPLLTPIPPLLSLKLPGELTA